MRFKSMHFYFISWHRPVNKSVVSHV